MCFEVPSSGLQVQVAEEDITVFKILSVHTVDPFSPYQYDHYKKSAVKAIDPERWDTSVRYASKGWDVGYGLHSFIRKEEAERYLWENVFMHNFKVYTMTIPKGAQYLKNDTQYVSNQLFFPAE